MAAEEEVPAEEGSVEEDTVEAGPGPGVEEGHCSLADDLYVQVYLNNIQLINTCF